MGYGSAVLNHAAVLQAADKDYRAIFLSQLEETLAKIGVQIDLLSMPVRSAKKIIQLAWLGVTPQMQEWIKDRVIQRLALDALSIQSKSWSNGIELLGDDVESDDMELYRPAIRELANEGVRHQRSLLTDLLNAGFGTTLGTAYDGLAFFHNAHVRAGTSITFDNLTDDVLDQAAYQSAVTRLRSIQIGTGRYLDLNPTHLVVAANLEWIGRSIVNQQFLSNGQSNITQGISELVVLNGLTDNYWFVGDFSRPIKPLVLFTKRDLRPDSMIDPSSSNVFHSDLYYWGASWKGNAGYGLPELIQGSDGSGS